MATVYTRFWGFGWSNWNADFSGKGIAVPYCPSVEVLYPIQTSAKSNKLVFRKDNHEWDVVKKSAIDWRHEYVTLRYRVRDTEIETFYNFFQTNKGSLVNLSTPGLIPFIRDDESNDVHIIGPSKPKLVFPKIFEMSVTFLNSARIATTP